MQPTFDFYSRINYINLGLHTMGSKLVRMNYYCNNPMLTLYYKLGRIYYAYNLVSYDYKFTVLQHLLSNGVVSITLV